MAFWHREHPCFLKLNKILVKAVGCHQSAYHQHTVDVHRHTPKFGAIWQIYISAVWQIYPKQISIEILPLGVMLNMHAINFQHFLQSVPKIPFLAKFGASFYHQAPKSFWPCICHCSGVGGAYPHHGPPAWLCRQDHGKGMAAQPSKSVALRLSNCNWKAAFHTATSTSCPSCTPAHHW